MSGQAIATRRRRVPFTLGHIPFSTHLCPPSLLFKPYAEQHVDNHSLVGASPSKRRHKDEKMPRGSKGLTVFQYACSKTADATSQVLHLLNLQDPALRQYRLDASEYVFYPLALLYTMYWNKGNRNLKTHRPFIPLPLQMIPGDELYCFRQYSYMERRVDAFREHHKNSGIPPGLAIIGTPGIGELIPFHLLT